MATLTIRNLSDEVVERIQRVAAQDGKSMEQTVRDLLEERFARRADVLDKVRARRAVTPKTSTREVDGWIAASRKR